MKGKKLLSDIAFYRSYSAIKTDGTKETWDEVCDRYENMMLEKYPHIQAIILGAMAHVREKRVLPSMRALQFAGTAIEKENARLYNCSFVNVTSFKDFADAMYLSACGTGVGYSVQQRHISQLPEIEVIGPQDHVVADSREGWADSLITLLHNPRTKFDYSEIRVAGTKLSTGGTASGPEYLMQCHDLTRNVLLGASGRKLTPFEVHLIMTYIADAIVAGGVRRSAMICLFDRDDTDMLSCKSGAWWERHPSLARANNSAVLPRDATTREEFDGIIDACYASQAGEPGVFWTSDLDWGTNPCCLSLDSNLLTPAGIKPLRDIKEGDLVWSGECWTKVLKKWKTGTKMVYRYETNAGYFLGTADHNVYQNDIKIRVDQAQSIDRCLGPILQATEMNPQDIMNGLLIGDGSIHKASNNLIGLYIGDKDVDYHTSEVAPLIKLHRPGVSPKFWTVETDLSVEAFSRVEGRPIPERYLRGTINQKIAFLRGIFSANGCVTAGRVQYKTACKTQAQQLQIMLSSLGYKTSLVVNKPAMIEHNNGTYTSKESYNLIMYNHSVEFMENIGFLQKYKMEKEVKNTTEKNVSSEIRNVVEVGMEEVYDIMVEDVKHRFWCDGLLVSNCEIALRSRQFCNLTEINVAVAEDKYVFRSMVWAATVLGTLQAGFTNFNYIHPDWQKNAEEDALLGVGMTGQAERPDLMTAEFLHDMADVAKHVNAGIADMIGINKAKRIGTVKPSGTTSTVLGTASGIHAAHAPYYLRRIRISKMDPVAKELVKVLPEEFVEHSQYEPHNRIIKLPMKMDGITRHDETALELGNRALMVRKNWIEGSHREGENYHNVSLTINYKPHEQEELKDWMWENRASYGGISLLPFSDTTYAHAPFEDCTQEEYERLEKLLPQIDLSVVKYEQKDDGREASAACEGGLCEVKIRA